jgi:hypothetical protein
MNQVFRESAIAICDYKIQKKGLNVGLSFYLISPTFWAVFLYDSKLFLSLQDYTIPFSSIFTFFIVKVAHNFYITPPPNQMIGVIL